MYKIDRLREMSETDLQKYVLQPLLEAKEFHDVSIYHGSQEKGKDIICWHRDELGSRRNLALVVKAVRLTGHAKVTKGTLSEVSTQVQQCFCNTFTDPVSGETQQIHQCWVVSNQDITKEAVEQLNVLLKPSGYDRNVSFIDHEKLLKLLEEYVPEPPLFQVANHHVPSYGEPPHIDDKKPDQYLGYFENEFGEQTIFIYEQETARGTLYMGDAGWEDPYEVCNAIVPGLIMNKPELMWLTACWEAATAFDH